MSCVCTLDSEYNADLACLPVGYHRRKYNVKGRLEDGTSQDLLKWKNMFILSRQFGFVSKLVAGRGGARIWNGIREHDVPLGHGMSCSARARWGNVRWLVGGRAKEQWKAEVLGWGLSFTITTLFYLSIFVAFLHEVRCLRISILFVHIQEYTFN